MTDHLRSAMQRKKPVSKRKLKAARPGTLLDWYTRTQWSIIECADDNKPVPEYLKETNARLWHEMFSRMLSGDAA